MLLIHCISLSNLLMNLASAVIIKFWLKFVFAHKLHWIESRLSFVEFLRSIFKWLTKSGLIKIRKRKLRKSIINKFNQFKTFFYIFICLPKTRCFWFNQLYICSSLVATVNAHFLLSTCMHVTIKMMNNIFYKHFLSFYVCVCVE